MKIKTVILLLTLISAAGIAVAQTLPSRTNLTGVLNRILSEHNNVRISFSPNLTDKVFPKDTNIEGNVSEVLKRVLNGTEFTFKVIDGMHFYIYRQEQKTPAMPSVKEAVLPKKEEPRPDTVRLHTIVIPIADGIKPIYTYEWKKPTISLPDLLRIVPISESVPKEPLLPVLAVKSNLLYDATTSMNLGIEIGLAPKWTLDISGNYNPWIFSDNRKMKHWLIQPEIRWWACQRFSGHFFGLHTHFSQFNIGGMLPWGFNSGKMFGSIENKNIMSHRYEGWLAGAGAGYGYHWVLGNRWGMEAEIGIGYAYLKYDEYRCEKCSEKLKSEYKNYFGPTKATVALIFMIR